MASALYPSYLPVYESVLIDFLERSLELDLTERSLAINAEERLLILGVIGVPIIGDTIRLTAQFKNWTGELDDPSDVSVLVRRLDHGLYNS